MGLEALDSKGIGTNITWDRATRDEGCYYWFVGRAEDVINTGGHIVGPFEVESVLIEHPAVAEARIIGLPKTKSGKIMRRPLKARELGLPEGMRPFGGIETISSPWQGQRSFKNRKIVFHDIGVSTHEVNKLYTDAVLINMGNSCLYHRTICLKRKFREQNNSPP